MFGEKNKTFSIYHMALGKKIFLNIDKYDLGQALTRILPGIKYLQFPSSVPLFLSRGSNSLQGL